MNPNDKPQADEIGSEARESKAPLSREALSRRFEDLAVACEVKANHCYSPHKGDAVIYRAKAAVWREAAKMVRKEKGTDL